MRLRLTRYVSAICLFLLSGLSLFIPELLSKLSGQTVEGAWMFAAMISLSLFLLGVPEAKGYVLTDTGIEVCFFGIRYRTVKWGDICDVVLGIDPFERYSGKTTILLDIRQGIIYRIVPHDMPPFYDRELFTSLLKGQVIRLRCGNSLEQVMQMIEDHYPGEIRGRSQ